MSNPWDRATGWEYDLLRTLPPEEQKRVWKASWERALRTGWPVLVVYLVFLPLLVLHFLSDTFARQFGGGHIEGFMLGLWMDHRYVLFAMRYLPSLARPFVRQELAELAAARME